MIQGAQAGVFGRKAWRLARFLPGVMVAVTWCMWLGPPCLAQSPTSWDALPEAAVVAVRIPDGKAFAEAIRETKLGTVMFSEKRKEAVVKSLESRGAGELSELQEQLEEYGLTTDELISMLAGESGYAVVIGNEQEDDPKLAGLAWLEPGAELAVKIYEILGRVIDEQDQEHPITRIDVELSDRSVMQLQVPSIEIEHEQEFELGDEYGDLPDEQQSEAWDKAYKAWSDSAVETIAYRTVLISTLGGRVLIAHSFAAVDAQEVDAEAEFLLDVFGQWMEAHVSETEGFVTRLANEPGIARVMALEGWPVLELLGDVAPFVELLRASAPTEEEADQLVNMLGLHGLGPFALRSTTEGAKWKTNTSLAVPAPRQGLMQLLDQELLPVDPPQWVPANAMRYYQWSFDLGRAYEIIKEQAIREFAEQMESRFAMVEMQVQSYAQASLSEVLSSLGNRHTYISFGLESSSLAEGDSSEGTNSIDGNPSDNSPDDDDPEQDETVSERIALVWQVEDEELWSRLLKAITPFADMASGVESTEEQGFSGWRVKRGVYEGGLFLGKGYLVLGYGSGLIESMLSSLNNPPTGSDALRGSQVFATAQSLIDLEPSLVVEVTDGDRYLAMLMKVLDQQLARFATLVEQGAEEGSPSFMPALRAILPSEGEVEGMLGVIVSRWEVNDDGVFGESVQELPPP